MRWVIFCIVCSLGMRGEACTAFQLKGQDGSLVYGRSMEFGFALKSNVLIIPRGVEYVGSAPNGQSGLAWKSQYGIVGMNQSFAKNLVCDGINERGLVVSALYLPGYASYEMPKAVLTDKTLGPWELPTYLLATCATIADVKNALPTVLVAQEPMPGMKDFVLPVHFYVADSTGAVATIEYTKGKRCIFDNPYGVLTNSPTFKFHLDNLSNYVNLSPYNAPEMKGITPKITSLGQGTGLLGLPGDWTPPSRFVRAVLFSQWANQPADSEEGVQTAFHILNTFDIFKGIVRGSSNPREKSQMDSTEWIVVYDRSEMKLYIRTYEGQKIQMVDISKIDFSQGGFRQMYPSKQFSAEELHE